MNKTTLLMLLLSTAALACGEDKTEDSVAYQKPQAWAQSPLCGLSYSPTKVGKKQLVSVMVRNEGKQALTVSKVEIVDDSRGFLTAALGAPDTADYKQSVVIGVTYAPTAAGWDRARLKITSNAENYPTLYIPILALAYPADQEDPTKYNPGAKPTHDGDTSELCPPPEE